MLRAGGGAEVKGGNDVAVCESRAQEAKYESCME